MQLRDRIEQKLSRELFLEIQLDGTVKDVTSNCLNIIGYTKEELIGCNTKKLFEDDELDAILNENENFETKEITVISKNKNIIYMDIKRDFIKEDNKNIIYLSMIDITEYKERIVKNIQIKKELEEKLIYLRHHDPLTDIYNRTYFEKYKNKLDAQENKKVGLIICDLDNLRSINNTLGNESGDKLIKQSSKLIQDNLGEDILVAKIDGDEFAIILEDVGYREVVETVENIKECIRNYNSNDPKIHIEMSIGYEYNHKSMGRMEEIFRNAHRNMYENKSKRTNKL